MALLRETGKGWIRGMGEENTFVYFLTMEYYVATEKYGLGLPTYGPGGCP